jgi:anti-sigma factor RsiW
MKECFEEGILQSYFDGELSIDMMESVSSHFASCSACKLAAQELENESLLLANALEPEFTLSVPSEQLRARIDAAIAESRLLNPARPSLATAHVPVMRRWLQAVADLLAVSPQRAFAYAGVAAIVLFAITFALIRFRGAPVPGKPEVAVRQTPTVPVLTVPAPAASPANSKEAVAVSQSPEKVNRSPFVQAAYKKSNVSRRSADRGEAAHVKLLPGERSYLKAIAQLDTTLKSDRNKPMRPSLQSEYERNLAMVDRAIAATRTAAKSNPSDPDAAEFMFAAYQTKVDLLNQVADARIPGRKQ